MSENDYSKLEKQVRRLWAALVLLFLMIIIIVTVLTFNFIQFYDMVIFDHIVVAFDYISTFVMTLGLVLVSFAVIIFAVAKHD
ncbi:MAG: hypothetical protein ACFFFK_07650 [Candidatus Thorarchaeota archaeon]